MEKRYELQSKALKNAWVILRRNNGKVSWSQCCKLGWDLVKKGKALKEEKPELNIESIYKQYNAQVFAYVFKAVFNNRELAEDITADTFVKVCTNIEKYDSTKAKLNTWIITIAKNIIIDRSRKNDEKVNGSCERIDGFVDENGNSTYQLDDNVQTPEDVLSNKEKAMQIKKGIDALSDSLRKVAIMRFLQDESYEDIAKALDMPLGTVKTNVNRARKQLQEVLKQVA